MRVPELVVNTQALNFNLKKLKALRPELSIFPVLKANAYGHGADLVATYLEEKFSEQEIPYFCVARVGEAADLRVAGVKRSLLVLSHFSEEDFQTHFPENTEIVVHSIQDFELLNNLSAAKLALISGYHLNFNTGMNRLGIKPPLNDILLTKILKFVKDLYKKGLSISGLMSHLASGEEELKVLSLRQKFLFNDVVKTLKASWNLKEMGPLPKWIHLENSGGHVQKISEDTCNAARLGIHLYGSAVVKGVELKNVLKLRAPVRQVFEVEPGEGVGYGHRFIAKEKCLLATVSLGYADGISRKLSRAWGEKYTVGFVVDSERVPIAGTVSMDMTMLDLSSHSKKDLWLKKIANNEALDLWAYFLCDQQSADDIAAALNTISYEVYCAFGHRLRRKIEGVTV